MPVTPGNRRTFAVQTLLRWLLLWIVARYNDGLGSVSRIDGAGKPAVGLLDRRYHYGLVAECDHVLNDGGHPHVRFCRTLLFRWFRPGGGVQSQAGLWVFFLQSSRLPVGSAQKPHPGNPVYLSRSEPEPIKLLDFQKGLGISLMQHSSKSLLVL